MTNPDRVAFSVFGKEIYWYAILMAFGIVVAAVIAFFEAKRKKLHEDTVIDMCIATIPLGIICARLYYVLFSLDYYLANPERIIRIWEGGLAIPGAILGGALGVFIYSRIKKVRFLKLVDVAAPGLVLAQAIGRWGNFFNQEAYGLQITDPSMLWFPFGVRIDATGTYHLATFFYESMACVIIFVVLWMLRKKFKHDGDVFLTYAALYAFERMFIEQLRTDSLMLGNIRITQLLCALVFLAVVVFFIVRTVKEKKTGMIMWPKQMSSAIVAENVPVKEAAVPTSTSATDLDIEEASSDEADEYLSESDDEDSEE